MVQHIIVRRCVVQGDGNPINVATDAFPTVFNFVNTRVLFAPYPSAVTNCVSAPRASATAIIVYTTGRKIYYR